MTTETKTNNTQANEIKKLQLALIDNLSPQGIAAIIAHLSAGSIQHPENEDHVKAMNEMQWFRETLLEIIGVREYNLILDEIQL